MWTIILEVDSHDGSFPEARSGSYWRDVCQIDDEPYCQLLASHRANAISEAREEGEKMLAAPKKPPACSDSEPKRLPTYLGTRTMRTAKPKSVRTVVQTFAYSHSPRTYPRPCKARHVQCIVR